MSETHVPYIPDGGRPLLKLTPIPKPPPDPRQALLAAQLHYPVASPGPTFQQLPLITAPGHSCPVPLLPHPVSAPAFTPAPKPPRKGRPRKPPASIPYGPGRYTPAPNGRGFDCLLCSGSIRHRARVPDEASARAWLESQAESLRLGRPPLTRLQLLDAADAYALLPPGTSLLTAIQAYAATANLPRTPLSAATASFLEDRTHSAQSGTLGNYRQALAQLTLIAGPDTPVSDITPEHITHTIGPRTGITRNNILRHLSTFFTWSIRHKLLIDNPVTGIPRARVIEPSRGILTIPQVTALLTAAQTHRPQLCPYLTLALFAGIRAEELTRLNPDRIGQDWITIDGHVAKTSSHRTIPIRPNLRAWLDHYPPANPIPQLSKKHLYAALRTLCAQTGIIPTWPVNCMRHSYASYAYDHSHDAALTASEMGHRGTDIFFRHYRGLVNPGDGAKYFAIFPTFCQ